MSLMQTALVGGTIIQNFNPRFAARASKDLLRASKAGRKDLQSETDPTLALADVEALHVDVLDPAQDLVAEAERVTDDLQNASDVLLGAIEPDPTHASPIVRTASDLAITGQQVRIALPHWDTTPLTELGEELADAANGFGEVAIACKRRLELTRDECEFAVAEATAKSGSDLNALTRFNLPPALRDIDRFVDLGNHQVNPTKATIGRDAAGQVTILKERNPDYVDGDELYRKNVRQALIAKKTAKSGQRKRAETDIKKRLEEAWV